METRLITAEQEAERISQENILTITTTQTYNPYR